MIIIPQSMHYFNIHIIKMKASQQKHSQQVISNNEAHSSVSNGARERRKMPQSIIISIRNQQIIHAEVNPETKFKQQQIQIQDIIPKLRQKDSSPTYCKICLTNFNVSDKTNLCKCQHSFCFSCLQHYVIYKVKMFEEVYCPDEQCQEIINLQSKLYSQLPADIKKYYEKIHRFYSTIQNKKLRLCPNQKCEEGVLQIQQQTISVKCNLCQIQYCSKCFFKMHDGQCEQNQINFFQNNLHYRQCRMCKFIISKIQGCDHITCNCGHQFCYVCSSDWEEGHYCVNPNPPVPQQQGPQFFQTNFGDCFCIFKIPIKIIFFILNTLLLVLVLAVSMARIVLIIPGFILAGFIFFPLVTIAQADCPLMLIMIIIPIIPILIGIYQALKNVLIPTINQSFQDVQRVGITYYNILVF